MMLGFPDEKEEDFQDLLALVERIRFHKLGAFVYSPEEDTAAYSYPNRVDLAVANKRYKQLLSRQQEISKQRNQELLNQELEVLVEGKGNLKFDR
jgi:tRNA A37 methylthiotransferase MiaB